MRSARPFDLGRVVGRASVGAAVTAALWSALCRPAYATTFTVAGGMDLTLDADLVLGAGDSLMAGDDSGARCTIHGAGHGIRTADDPAGSTPWASTVSIRNCDVYDLGTAGGSALDIEGTGAVAIEGNTFATSGGFTFGLVGAMSVTFRGNTVLENSVVINDEMLVRSQDAFLARDLLAGATGTRRFQGNRFFKGRLHFNNTHDWLVGGAGPQDGNVLVGLRAGLLLENASRMHVVGNYVHTLTGPVIDCRGWNQVKNLSLSQGDGNIVEHNVLRGINWVAEIAGGVDLRYNLMSENVERGWVTFNGHVGAKIHHNLLIATKEVQASPAGAFVLEPDLLDATPDAEVFNNTVDAGGLCNPEIDYGALWIKGPETLASLRSNVFTGIRVEPGRALSMDRVAALLATLSDGARFLYSDYNFFYNPDSPVQQIYGFGVDGKILGVDSGFGLHDLPAGGSATAPGAALAPGFVGPVPRGFRFTDEQVIAGLATPCQILAFYRQAYQPGAASPLVDHGDPQDGAGNDIGAIGAGADNPLDQFGKLCDPRDTGHPIDDAGAYHCDPVALEVPVCGGGAGGGGGGAGAGGGGAGGIVTPPPMPRGVSCICAVDSAGPAGIGGRAAALGAGIVLAAIARRRRRR